MKTNKALARTLRKSLDQKLKPYIQAQKTPRPVGGWIQAIRESLGMTTSQLASRMKIHQSGILALQKRELSKTASLDSLERAAKAMNCELVYAFVPKDSLDQIVEEQCKLYASQVLSKIEHTMGLEDQKVTAEESQAQLEELINELKRKLDSRIWTVK